MKGIILNKTDFEVTQLAIHNILKNRDDYNSERYANPAIKTTNGEYILVEPKNEWLTAISSLGLKFINIDNGIISNEDILK